MINADGSDAKNLTENQGQNTYPAWSRDGKKIAFTSTRDGSSAIYVMDADGKNVKQLTNGESEDRAPAWSPDGKKIAFCRHLGNNWEIFVMDADGSNQVNLTDDPARDADPFAAGAGWAQAERPGAQQRVAERSPARTGELAMIPARCRCVLTGSSVFH